MEATVSRRAVAVLVFVALVLVPAGALSGVFASGTTGSGLAVAAANGHNGDYADFSGGQLALDFSAGGGLSDNAINRFDAVFVVTNDRSYEAPVWINDSSDAISFYNTDSEANVEGEENGPSLAPGESLVVGVAVDTREANVEAVESTDNFSVETLVEEATDPDSGTTSGTDTSSTETGGAGSTATPTATESTGTTGGTGETGGDGGGSGGGQSQSTASSYTVYDTTAGATISVRDGVASDPIAADLLQGGTAYVSGDGTTVESADLALTFDRSDWRTELTDPTDSPQDAPAVSSGEPVSYFRFDAYNVEASAFDTIAVNLTLTELPSGTDPSQVSVYRETADGWQAVETTHLGGDRYRAETGGFGALAVVVESPTSGTDSGSSGTNTGNTSGTSAGADGSIDGTRTDSDGTTTATETAAADAGSTPTATAVDRFDDPDRLQSGMGPATVLVFGLFSVWLGVRARVGGGPGGL